MQGLALTARGREAGSGRQARGESALGRPENQPDQPAQEEQRKQRQQHQEHQAEQQGPDGADDAEHRLDHQAQQLRNFALYVFAVAVIATMVMGFVLQRRAHTRLGVQKVELEVRARELRGLTNYHAILLAQHATPLALIRRAESLGLNKISATQRLFITLPPLPLIAAVTNQTAVPAKSPSSGPMATAGAR